MTNADCVNIAKAMINLAHGQISGDEGWGAWIGCVNALADVMQKEVVNFDRHGFRDACGWLHVNGVNSNQI